MPTDSTSTPTGRLRRWLSRPGVAWLAVASGLALCAPSIATGLQTEDIGHMALSRSMEGFGNLFRPDVLVTNRVAKAEGLLPWLAADDLRLWFYRPVASLTHHLDYRGWPELPWLMHVHSLAWFGLVLAAVMLAYRRLSSSVAVATLATLLYAVDEGHGAAVGWLANRSALMATAFGTLAIVAHDRWRRDGLRSGAVLGPALLGLGLLSSESAVQAVAYLLAYALFIERGPPLARLKTALPWLVVLFGWAIAYRAMGYGARGSGIYLDPIGQPVAFASQAVGRLALLLGGQLGPVPTDGLVLGWSFWPTPMVLFAWTLIFIFSVVSWPFIRRNAELRFWALGALLGSMVACATLPSDRMMFLPGVGVMAVMATVISAVLDVESPHARVTRATVVVAWFWVVVHGTLSPVVLPMRATGLRSFDDRLRIASDDMIRAARPDQTLVLLNAPDHYTGMILAGMRRGAQGPGSMSRVLHGGWDGLSMRRVDDRTIRLRPDDGFLAHALNRVFRGDQRPFAAGDAVDVPGMSATVKVIDDRGRPMVVDFQFTQTLESGALRFVAFDGARFHVVPPPSVNDEQRFEPELRL